MQKGFSLLLLLIGVILVGGLVGGAYYIGVVQTKKTLPQSQIIIPTETPAKTITEAITETPTLTPTQVSWKTYAEEGKFSFSYPSDWNLNNKTFTYTEDGKTYKMVIATAGSGGPEADEITDREMIINDRKFSVKTWIKNGKPFFISFAGMEPGTDKYFNHIEIQLPPTNTEKYTQLFNQILSTLKFNN